MHFSAPKLLLDTRASLGEGPAWDAARQLLYWVDILPGHLYIYDPASGVDKVVEVGGPLGCVAPTRSGGLVMGIKDSISALILPSLMDLPDSSSMQPAVITRPEAHLPGNRFNDGKCAPNGHFLLGSMDLSEKDPSGFLYSLAPDGTCQTLLDGIYISNGLAWSPDHKTLYYIDTPTRQVVAYDYDLTSGNIANPRAVITVPDGMGWPDGMTSDIQGRLWVALWGGAALTVWNPADGQLLETIHFPAKNMTSCAFGGPDLTDLYVTSARINLDASDLAAYPASGCLFRLQTDVTGMPTFLYGD